MNPPAAVKHNGILGLEAEDTVEKRSIIQSEELSPVTPLMFHNRRHVVAAPVGCIPGEDSKLRGRDLRCESQQNGRRKKELGESSQQGTLAQTDATRTKVEICSRTLPSEMEHLTLPGWQ
ncbi:hypothetical protein INR49_020844 [Caranx melampygus]|nr:hypothetical protein INR49_020844 [Caranx melampygus]